MRVGRPASLRDPLWLLGAVALVLPAIVLHLAGVEVSDVATVVATGVAILGAAILLSWSVEIAERYVPQSLALLVLALVGVLPEYAIDLHFAWSAGQDPSYAPYAVANMTGANRLLIGVGWALVVLVATARAGQPALELHPRQLLEIRFLAWTTIYSFLIPLRGQIGPIDALILLGLFVAYVRAASRGGSEDPELVGPALWISLRFDDPGRIAWASGLFALAGYAIWASAEPFSEGLVHLGLRTGLDEFLLVQWIAPLASESPEFVVALLFAWKLRGSVGIGTLISSKVNQWTLLVGAIPIAYALSSGGFAGLPLDERQTEELLLTSAQSLLAAILAADLRFGRREAGLLLVLFLAQLGFPSTEARWWFIGAYLALAAGLLVFGPQRQTRSFLRLVFSLPRRETA